MKVLHLADPGQGLGSEGAILNPLSLLLLDLTRPSPINSVAFTSGRVSLCPCICRAICSLRARRAHCAYRRVLSRTDSAPAARNIAPVGASIPHRLFHCQSYWRTHPEPFGARECNADTPSDQKSIPGRSRATSTFPGRPRASRGVPELSNFRFNRTVIIFN